MIKFIEKSGGSVMNNSIIEFLNLKDEEIEDIKINSLINALVVEISLKRKEHQCPSCGCTTSKVLNTYTRKFQHGIFLHRNCIVFYHQKRYRCMVCKFSFNETNTLVNKGQKKSILSHLMIMDLLKDPHITFKFVAEKLNLSITTIINTFINMVPDYRQPLPKVLCIDEIYLGRKSYMKYCAVLLDFETNQMVDVIYGRTKSALHSYFQKIPLKQRENVKYLSSDMYEGFRAMKDTYFRYSKQCVDAFHVIQLINVMFENQIKRIMKQYELGSTPYYLLKQRRGLLLRNANRIDWTKRGYNYHFKYVISNHKMRELMFQIDPLIESIYRLKEDYLYINSLSNVEIVEEKLNQFITRCTNFEHPDVKRVGKTLLKWRKEILNSFTRINGRRISNGPIESRNNIIKLIIRNAAGYRNFDHLRLRILYVINSKKE